MINIPIYKPSLSGHEKKYVLECLDSSWISSKGRFIDEFERDFSVYCGVNYATGVCNGTVALHLALVALGIGPGDEVLVPTLTYIASVNAIRYVGAKPIFVDSCPTTWQMSPEDLRNKITNATRAIMVVHLYGHPCEMDALMALSREHGLMVVEDCAEAIGSQYKGRHVGTFGDVATFSFYGNKTITTGEGGMLVTNDPMLMERARHYRGQGLAKNREYWHDVVGFNYRMTNICAAIGLAQLEQIDQFLIKKRAIAAQYAIGMKGLPISMHLESSDVVHSYWMCTMLVANAEHRDGLRKHLAALGVETRPVFYPIHMMPMYVVDDKNFPIAERIASQGINLPSWPGMSEEMIGQVIDGVRSFYEEL